MSIGGVPWSVGNHCLYQFDANSATHLGTVVNMFYGMDEMEEDFVIFQVLKKPITTRMGHYCEYSTNSQDMDMVLWKQITWKCKLLAVRGGQSGMALPYASCTSRELMVFR